MPGSGSAVINFGSGTGSDYTTVAVTGQTGITTGATCEAWMMYETSSDHTADEHLIVPINLRCGNISNGVGFTIYAASEWLLNGNYTVRWAWA